MLCCRLQTKNFILSPFHDARRNQHVYKRAQDKTHALFTFIDFVRHKSFGKLLFIGSRSCFSFFLLGSGFLHLFVLSVKSMARSCLIFPLISCLVVSILHTRDLITGLFMRVKERGCNQCVISIFHF